MGNDLGYLPGEKRAKMSHWMQPVFDNLEMIIKSAKQQNLKSVDDLIRNKTLDIEAITYIRGRSLPKQYIIIDEAQNLTPHEVKNHGQSGWKRYESCFDRGSLSDRQSRIWMRNPMVLLTL